jgi:hypothetical protein
MMVERDGLLTRQGDAAIRIARELISLSRGERIPRVQDYARKLQIGNGTVQAALHFLENAGAIKLASAGHKGTYLVEVDYQRLWSVGGRSTVYGSMPLPYSRRYEGLATGLYSAVRAEGPPLALSYMRGARNRLAALRERHVDLVVLSAFAKEQVAQEWPVAVVVGLGPGTYAEHALILRNGVPAGLQTGMRVGIDQSSIDQQLLIEAEAEGYAVVTVEVGYMHAAEMLRRGEIDATIWNVDELPVRFPELQVVPLQTPRARAIARLAGEAVLVTRPESPEVSQIANALIDWNAVLQVQAEVVAGRRHPAY